MATRRTILATGAAAATAATIPTPAYATAPPPKGRPRTGWVYGADAVFGWDTGTPQGIFPADPDAAILPDQHFENRDTKDRIYQLLDATRLDRHLHRVEARPATDTELLRVHTRAHLTAMKAASDSERGALVGGPDTAMPHHGDRIARMTAGGGVDLARAVASGQLANGYMLMRPPGHHARPGQAMGFCIYNNLAVAATTLLTDGVGQIMVVDWDVHTGNGTQEIFGDESRVVIVDVHQRECFPPGAGHVDARGKARNIINVDLAPGSGHEAMMYTLDRVILPAIHRVRPGIVLVSSGFDSALTDPLGRLMYGSDTYRKLTRSIVDAVPSHRLVGFHEGGYEHRHVQWCALAVMEELTGVATGNPDPWLVTRWMRAGNRPEELALQRRRVDESARLVAELPTG